MTRSRPRRVLYALVTAATALGTTVAVAGTSSAATSASAPSWSPIQPHSSTRSSAPPAAVDHVPRPRHAVRHDPVEPGHPRRTAPKAAATNTTTPTADGLTAWLTSAGRAAAQAATCPSCPTVGAIGSSPSSTTDSVHARQRDRSDRPGYSPPTLGMGSRSSSPTTTRAGIGTFNFPRPAARPTCCSSCPAAPTRWTGPSCPDRRGQPGDRPRSRPGTFCGQSAPPENDYTLPLRHRVQPRVHLQRHLGRLRLVLLGDQRLQEGRAEQRDHTRTRPLPRPPPRPPRSSPGPSPTSSPRTQPQPTVHGRQTASLRRRP